jgi:chromosome segregation ATPase
MPDNENDLSGKVSLDITNFKANIAQLNQQIKVVETGFKAAAAGMEDWGASEEGLQLRLKALNDIINLQKQKVENLKEQYIKIAAEKGETSKAARDLQIKINNETAALNKNQAELQSTTNKLKNFGKESEEASKKTSLFTKIF